VTDKPHTAESDQAVFRLQPQRWSTRKRAPRQVTVKPLEVWELPPLKGNVPEKKRRVRLDGGLKMKNADYGETYLYKQTCDASGQEFLNRINKLEQTLPEFSNRTGLSLSTVMRQSRKPAGYFPLWLMRLLEFEEMLAAIATALDRDRRPNGSRTLREELTTLFDVQVDTIAGRGIPAARRS
jgi:hypothetical protein